MQHVTDCHSNKQIFSCMLTAMNMSTVVLASDHAGFPLKEQIKTYLQGKGMTVKDVGTFSTDPVDYPAIIRKGCEEVLKDDAVGIVFGGSGNGEAMAANKMRGIRAAVVYSEETARLARAHNDANVMSLGARLTDPSLAPLFVDIFLATPFDGGRHTARVQDLDTPLLS